MWILAVLIAAMGFAVSSGSGEETVARGEAFHDDLLDRLAGKWLITRKMGSREARNDATAEWVLGHQFLHLHMIDREKPPHYEAEIYIGYDPSLKHYVIQWMDNFGGQYSLRGTGERKGDSIGFLFSDSDGEIRNTYAFSGNRWTSTIVQRTTGGEWKPFCTDVYERRK